MTLVRSRCWRGTGGRTAAGWTSWPIGGECRGDPRLRRGPGRRRSSAPSTRRRRGSSRLRPAGDSRGGAEPAAARGAGGGLAGARGGDGAVPLAGRVAGPAIPRSAAGAAFRPLRDLCRGSAAGVAGAAGVDLARGIARGVAGGGGHAPAGRAIEALARARGARFHYGAAVRRIEVAGGAARAVRLADGRRLAADRWCSTAIRRLCSRVCSARRRRGRWRRTRCSRDRCRPGSGASRRRRRPLRSTITMCSSLAIRRESFATSPRADAVGPDALCLRAGSRDGKRTGRDGAVRDHHERAGRTAPGRSGSSRHAGSAPRDPVADGPRPSAAGPAGLTTPADFAALFPGSGGSLYGRSPHGLTRPSGGRGPGAPSRGCTWRAGACIRGRGCRWRRCRGGWRRRR